MRNASPVRIPERGIAALCHSADLSMREGGGRRGNAAHQKGGYMKVFKGLALVTTVALALVAQGSAAGPATTVFVGAQTNEPGLNTGLVLKKGSVTVTATGVVCAHYGTLCVSPDGMLTDTTLTSFGGFVLSGAPAFGLVGRVGSGPWVQVGSGTTLSGNGELVFAVNDFHELFADNTGGFTVSVSKKSGVSRTCWPGWGWGDINHVHCGPPGQEKKSGESSQPTQGSSSEQGKSEEEHGKSEEKGNPNK
jgi:hypothetical protein